MAEGAALEMLYTLIAYRGFESLPLLQKKETYRKVCFLFLYDRRDSKEKARCLRQKKGF